MSLLLELVPIFKCCSLQHICFGFFFLYCFLSATFQDVKCFLYKPVSGWCLRPSTSSLADGEETNETYLSKVSGTSDGFLNDPWLI